MRLIAAGALCWATVLQVPLEAQQSRSGIVVGRVIAAFTGEPVRLATVSVAGTSLRALTDDDGRFRFLSVAPGEATIRVRSLGFLGAEASLIVVSGLNPELVIRLEVAPLLLRPVETRENSARQRFKTQPDVGSVGFTRTAVTGLPAVGEADLLRMVQTLPGVSARNDYSAGYNVRGGESDQNLILLDGIPLYNPFHLGGLFSTFIDESVGDIRLLTGGFPASYGGRLSSVLDVTSAQEARQGVHGTVGVSLLSSRVALGGALPSGRDTWNVSARRTYADKVADALSDDVAFPYHFQDLNVHVSHIFGGGGSLSFTAYAGQDVVDDPEAVDDGGGTIGPGETPGGPDDFSNDPESFRFDWGNRVVGLNLVLPADGAMRSVSRGTKPLLDSAAYSQRVSVSQFDTHLDLGTEGLFGFANRVTDLRVAGVLSGARGPHAISAGYDFSHYIIKYRVDAPVSTVHISSLEQRPSAISGFVDDVWRVSDRWLLQPGIRLEHLMKSPRTYISPAVSAKYFVTEEFAITGAAGRYSQWMHSLREEELPLRIYDFWVSNEPTDRISRATHLVGGAEAWAGDNHFARVETYHKRYDDLLEPNTADDPLVSGDQFVNVSGSSYGADVFIRRLGKGRLSGWITYGYGVSRRRAATGREYFPAQDRRHNLTLVAGLRAPGKSTVGARFNWSSGTPYTAIEGEMTRWEYDPFGHNYRSTSANHPTVAGPRNGMRYPGYHRLDLSAERSFRLGADNKLTTSLHVVNVYNRKNVFTYHWDYSGSPPSRTPLPQFPILPSIGVTLDF